jgi:hypothetical protein
MKAQRGVEVWLHSVSTSAPEASEWSRHSPVALPPTENPGRLPLEVEASWAPESVWMCSEVRKSRTGIRTANRAACNPGAVPTTIPLSLHSAWIAFLGEVCGGGLFSFEVTADW